MMACDEGHTEVVKQLLTHASIDVNLQDQVSTFVFYFSITIQCNRYLKKQKKISVTVLNFNLPFQCRINGQL